MKLINRIKNRSVRVARGASYRSWLMVFALFSASSGFVLLHGNAGQSKLEVVETLESNSRAGYDILVRPSGAQSEREKSLSLVRPGFLSSLNGGISREQWQSIKGIQGVEAAAPVALVGTMVYKHRVDVGADSPSDNVSVLDVDYRYDRGLSTVSSDSQYYIPDSESSLSECLSSPVRSRVNSGDDVAICAKNDQAKASAQSVEFDFPFTIAAIDPVEENKLSGLAGAVVEGEYLSAYDSQKVDAAADFPGLKVQTLPVLISSKSYMDVVADYKLRTGKVDGIHRLGDLGQIDVSSMKLAAEGSVTGDDAYAGLVEKISKVTSSIDQGNRSFVEYVYSSLGTVYRADLPKYKDRGDTLEPVEQDSSVDQWIGPGEYPRDKTFMPPGGDDTSFRDLDGVYKEYSVGGHYPPIIVKSGTFDPEAVYSGSELSSTSMGLYSGSVIQGAEEDTVKLLGGERLLSSTNLRGYAQSPPLMVTSIDALDALTGPGWDSIVAPEGKSFQRSSVIDPSNPISAIRVRVSDVDGLSEESRARVNLVADQITQITGLQVDITLGVSPTSQELHLPGGKYGRPDLVLSEMFTKKGVAVSIKKAIDNKTIILFVAILVVSLMLMINLMLASVRARHSEIALKRCVGWGRLAIFRQVILEAIVLSLVAGTISSSVIAVSKMIGLFHASHYYLMLPIPLAMVVALGASLVAAYHAVRIRPMDAFAGTVTQTRSTTGSSLSAMAIQGVLRTPGRSALAVVGLILGVFSSSLILLTILEFNGAVVGSVLGEAVTVQVRASDIFASVGIVGMAVLGVLNVVFVNVRERGKELATFRALGWSRGKVSTMLLLESSIIGAIGAGVASIACFCLFPAIFDTSYITLSLVLLFTFSAGVLVSGLASLPPALVINRIPLGLALTEE